MKLPRKSISFGHFIFFVLVFKCTASAGNKTHLDKTLLKKWQLATNNNWYLPFKRPKRDEF